MESDRTEQLVLLLVGATGCAALLLGGVALGRLTLDSALVGVSSCYGAALTAGVFGPTDYWDWPGVAVIQGETTRRDVLASVLQFYGLLSVGFGCGYLLATLVL